LKVSKCTNFCAHALTKWAASQKLVSTNCSVPEIAASQKLVSTNVLQGEAAAALLAVFFGCDQLLLEGDALLVVLAINNPPLFSSWCFAHCISDISLVLSSL
jgi:hypothetical protein